MRKFIQPFYTAYVIITFVVSLLSLFPFFVVASIGSTIAGRRAIYKVLKYWAKWWVWVIGMPVTISGPMPPERRYVMVVNHISYLDTVIIFPALPYYFRALGKMEMSRIPVFGFLYRQIVVLVDRSNPQSRERSMEQMKEALEKESSIIIFPEGTFNETEDTLKEFYNGAFRLAIAAQTPILPVIFPDTVHRWHYSHWWKMWPGRDRVIYLSPVETAGLTADDEPALKQKVFDIMKEALESYDYRKPEK